MMASSTLLHLTPYFLTLVLAGWMLVISWQRRAVSGATELALLAVGGGLWIWGYIFELLNASQRAKIFWDNFQYIGFFVVAMSAFLFAATFAGYRNTQLRLIWILPLSALPLIISDVAPEAMRSNVRLIPGDPFDELSYGLGPLSALTMVYGGGVALAGLYLLFRHTVIVQAAYRGQARIVLLGFTFPFMIMVLSMVEVIPLFHRDSSPIALIVGVIIISWGLFRHRLLDLVPVARTLILENMADAILVLDAQNRIVDLNPAALPPDYPSVTQVIGRPIREIFIQRANLIERYEHTYTVHEEIEVEIDDNVYYLDFRVSPIYDRRGVIRGRLIVWRDISDRRQAENALRKNEERLRGIISSLDDLVMVLDQDGVCVDFHQTTNNQRLESAKELILGKPFQDVMPPHVADKMAAALETLKQTDEVQEFGYSVDMPTGVEWFHTKMSMMKDPDGNYAGVTVVARNITQLRQADKALQESAVRYRRLVETSPDAITLLDLNGTFVTMNQQAALMYGFDTPEELMALYPNGLSLVAPDFQETAINQLRQALHYGKVINPTQELMFIKKTGDLFPVEIRSALETGVDGEPLGFISVIRDITGRKRIEAAEKEQRLMSEALADIAAILNSTLNPDQVLDLIQANLGKVVPHDASVISMIKDDKVYVVRAYGYEQSTPDAFFKYGVPLETIPNFFTMAATGKPCLVSDVAADTNWVHFPGFEWIASYAGAPIQIDGKTTGFLTLDSRQAGFFKAKHIRWLQAFAHQSATAIRNAQLYQQAQALAALEERQRLARDLHDAVSQSLFSASITAEMLLKLWDRDHEKAQQGLAQLVDLTRGAQAEMRSLLLELRPEALVETSIDELLHQVAVAFTGKTGLAVALDLDPIPPIPVTVKTTFYRVAQEALNNVLKHANANHVSLSLHVVEETIELAITDDGTGFDIHHTPSNRLGLKSIQERAEGIGARLTIDSAPNRGTRIVFQYPVQEE